MKFLWCFGNNASQNLGQPSDIEWCDFESLLRSLGPDQAGEEVDEDDAEGQGQDVDEQEGEGPPVQAGHHTPTGAKQIRHR